MGTARIKMALPADVAVKSLSVPAMASLRSSRISLSDMLFNQFPDKQILFLSDMIMDLNVKLYRK